MVGYHSRPQSVIYCSYQRISYMADTACPRSASAAAAPGRFSANGAGRSWWAVDVPLPLGQLPVILADNGLGFAAGGRKCLYIGIALRLDNGGKCIQPVADFLLRMRDLLREGFTFFTLKDTCGIGKLLFQIRQYVVCRFKD